MLPKLWELTLLDAVFCLPMRSTVKVTSGVESL